MSDRGYEDYREAFEDNCVIRLGSLCTKTSRADINRAITASPGCRHCVLYWPVISKAAKNRDHGGWCHALFPDHSSASNAISKLEGMRVGTRKISAEWSRQLLVTKDQKSAVQSSVAPKPPSLKRENSDDSDELPLLGRRLKKFRAIMNQQEVEISPQKKDSTLITHNQPSTATPSPPLTEDQQQSTIESNTNYDDGEIAGSQIFTATLSPPINGNAQSAESEIRQATVPSSPLPKHDGQSIREQTGITAVTLPLRITGSSEATGDGRTSKAHDLLSMLIGDHTGAIENQRHTGMTPQLPNDDNSQDTDSQQNTSLSFPSSPANVDTEQQHSRNVHVTSQSPDHNQDPDNQWNDAVVENQREGIVPSPPPPPNPTPQEPGSVWVHRKWEPQGYYGEYYIHALKDIETDTQGALLISRMDPSDTIEITLAPPNPHGSDGYSDFV
ncbi:hypothetical protein F4861DRAFT_219541 [Xylaria intraflava]|nr:hypothetical protein F4861DRAFT_219541 [Xylaria intraflava]